LVNEKNRESQNLRDGLLKELSEKLTSDKMNGNNIDKAITSSKGGSISLQLQELSKAIRKESL
jgi:hypothetical protein